MKPAIRDPLQGLNCAEEEQDPACYGKECLPAKQSLGYMYIITQMIGCEPGSCMSLQLAQSKSQSPVHPLVCHFQALLCCCQALLLAYLAAAPGGFAHG